MPRKKPPRGRPFQKGQSGNPGGRPSKKEFRDFLAEVVDEKNGTTRRDAVRLALYLKAINSRDRDQHRAIELICAYDMGKPIQGVELTGKDGEPLGDVSGGGAMLARLHKMTTGAMRRELEALRKRREEMTAKAPIAEAAAAAEPDASSSDSKP